MECHCKENNFIMFDKKSILAYNIRDNEIKTSRGIRFSPYSMQLIGLQ